MRMSDGILLHKKVPKDLLQDQAPARVSETRGIAIVDSVKLTPDASSQMHSNNQVMSI